MIQDLNRVMLIGYLGRVPEMRYTPTGKPVTSFSIVTQCHQDASDDVNCAETDWFNVVAWGSLAEACKEHLTKGQRVLIEGRMKTRRWQDADQVMHSCAEVVAQNVIPVALDLEAAPENPKRT